MQQLLQPQQQSYSTSVSNSPTGSSASAASGAATSTSTRTAGPDLNEIPEEIPNDNVYYPCLGNNCEAQTDFDVFSQDYQEQDEALLNQLFGNEEEYPNDAIVIEQPLGQSRFGEIDLTPSRYSEVDLPPSRVSPDGSRSTPPPPAFKVLFSRFLHFTTSILHLFRYRNAHHWKIA